MKAAYAAIDSQQLQAVKRDILNGLIDQKLIEDYIISHKIDQSDVYQAELQAISGFTGEFF